MRVAIDAQQTLGTATGMGEYVRGLLGALPETGVEAVPLRAPRYDPWRFDRRVLWDQGLLPLAALRSGAELLHCTSGSIPWTPPLPVVVTIHDVAWLRAQEHAPAYARWYFGKFAAGRWRSARAVIVDSAFTRSELLECVSLDPARVVVVHPGVDEAFASVRRAVDPEPTLLAVGTVERRKNLAVIIEALAELPGVRLICVGPSTPYQDECVALAALVGVSRRVEFRGYIPRAQLLELYARCTLAVVPSHYEGFGYAAAQALCAGLPLLAARSSSLVEVVGDDAPLLSPDRVESWRESIASAVAQPVALEESAARVRQGAIVRFGWTRCASATAAVYRSALAEGRALVAG